MISDHIFGNSIQTTCPGHLGSPWRSTNDREPRTGSLDPEHSRRKHPCKQSSERGKDRRQPRLWLETLARRDRVFLPDCSLLRATQQHRALSDRMGATSASRILKERHFMDHLCLWFSRLFLCRTMRDPLRSLWAAFTLDGRQYDLRCFLHWLGFLNHVWSVHGLLRSGGHIMRYVLFFFF